MRIISVPAKNSAFAALESMIDARLSLDVKGEVPFVLLRCYVFHRNYLTSGFHWKVKCCSGFTAKSELFTNILVVGETRDGDGRQ